jgi:hypothetical protein
MPAHCPKKPLKSNIYISASGSAAAIAAANYIMAAMNGRNAD